MAPIPKIQKLIASRKRYKVAYGGRGSGKSYGVATVMVHRAIAEKARFLCTRETQNSLEDSALAIMKRVIEDHGLQPYFSDTIHGLSCVSGSEFIFRGLQKPKRIKSLDGIKYCWVEEAQDVTQEAWDFLVPTVREPGSEIWVTFNPDQENDPTYKKFITEKRPDVAVEKVNYYDNPYLPAELRAEMEYDRATDYEKYLWVWEGECRTISDAQVFKGKYRVEPFETPETAVFYFGADWGFAQDPTTLVRCFIDGDRLFIDYEVYGVGVEITDTPTLFRSVPGADKWMITADSARPETISHMRNQGFRIRPSVKGKGSVEEGVQFLKGFREIVIHPRCKHTADEFKLYSYKTDKLTGEILPVIEDKNNHIIDATRYAIEAVRRAKMPAITFKGRIA